jgi:hypothetical protein
MSFLKNTLTICVFDRGAGKNTGNFRITYIRIYSTLLTAMQYKKEVSRIITLLLSCECRGLCLQSHCNAVEEIP